MRSMLWFSVAVLFAVFQTVTSINVDIPPHGKECFFEDLAVGDKMTVTFQVNAPASLNIMRTDSIDFWCRLAKVAILILTFG